jgi:MarR family transcriptional regulator, lower aerobic nicotinate degradation pathway regulator
MIPMPPMRKPPLEGDRERREDYFLDAQIGFILRQAQQRHTAIFASLISEGLTPTQWAAISKLHERGPCSQNLLGRLTAMDGATIKGVIDRLTRRGLTETTTDAADGRRLHVALTANGCALYRKARPIAERITADTLAPLNEAERGTLMALLRRLT